MDAIDAIDDQNSRFEDLACWQKKLTKPEPLGEKTLALSIYPEPTPGL